MWFLTALLVPSEEDEGEGALARPVGVLVAASLESASARPAKMANDGEAGGGGD